MDKATKRKDSMNAILKDLTHTDTSEFYLPHAIAVISNAVTYLVPAGRMLCIPLDDDFSINSSTEILKQRSLLLEEMDSLMDCQPKLGQKLFRRNSVTELHR
jgi:hypothetical protein